MMREASDDYLPDGYVTKEPKWLDIKISDGRGTEVIETTKPQRAPVDIYISETTENIIDDLKGIWKYAALDKHVENDNKKTPEEYIIILIKMWDYLDKLTKAAVESTIVELEGKIMSSNDPCEKALRTNLEQYLAVRMEQEKEQ